MSSSDPFLGGATGNLAIEYRERKRYIQYFREKGYPLLDTLYDKKLYGLVNEKSQVVSPTAVTKTFDDPSSEVIGLTYVVDLFEKFKKKYFASEAFQIPAALREMKVAKSYESFEENYNSHEIYLANKSINLFLDRFNGQTIAFDDFILAAEELIFDPSLEGTHFTRSGYALSADSSVYHTGLYIDLLPDQDAVPDDPKVRILDDPDFECFASIAYEYGFYVDANAPWRLVLNLESELVRENILNGRDIDRFDLFYSDVYRIKTGFDDYWSLSSLMNKLYAEYHRQADIRVPRMDHNFPPRLMLRFLLVNRFREIGLLPTYSSLSSGFFQNILQKTVDLYHLYGLSSNVGSLGFINKVCGEHVERTLKANENIANFGYRKKLQGNLSFPRV